MAATYFDARSIGVDFEGREKSALDELWLDRLEQAFHQLHPLTCLLLIENFQLVACLYPLSCSDGRDDDDALQFLSYCMYHFAHLGVESC